MPEDIVIATIHVPYYGYIRIGSAYVDRHDKKRVVRVVDIRCLDGLFSVEYDNDSGRFYFMEAHNFLKKYVWRDPEQGG